MRIVQWVDNIGIGRTGADYEMAITLQTFAEDFAAQALRESQFGRATDLLRFARALVPLADDISARLESLDEALARLRQANEQHSDIELHRPSYSTAAGQWPPPWDEGFEPRSVDCLRLVRDWLSADGQEQIDKAVDAIMTREIEYAVLYHRYCSGPEDPKDWDVVIGTRVGCHCCGQGCHICEPCQPLLPQEIELKSLVQKLREPSDD
jgi:hypothetical protein